VQAKTWLRGFHAWSCIERDGETRKESGCFQTFQQIEEKAAHDWEQVPVIAGEIQIPEKIPGVEGRQDLADHPCSKDPHQGEKRENDAVQGPNFPLNPVAGHDAAIKKNSSTP
jgi:hypothetical protein